MRRRAAQTPLYVRGVPLKARQGAYCLPESPTCSLSLLGPLDHTVANTSHRRSQCGVVRPVDLPILCAQELVRNHQLLGQASVLLTSVEPTRLRQSKMHTLTQDTLLPLPKQ